MDPYKGKYSREAHLLTTQSPSSRDYANTASTLNKMGEQRAVFLEQILNDVKPFVKNQNLSHGFFGLSAQDAGLKVRGVKGPNPHMEQLAWCDGSYDLISEISKEFLGKIFWTMYDGLDDVFVRFVFPEHHPQRKSPGFFGAYTLHIPESEFNTTGVELFQRPELIVSLFEETFPEHDRSHKSMSLEGIEYNTLTTTIKEFPAPIRVEPSKFITKNYDPRAASKAVEEIIEKKKKVKTDKPRIEVKEDALFTAVSRLPYFSHALKGDARYHISPKETRQCEPHGYNLREAVIWGNRLSPRALGAFDKTGEEHIDAVLKYFEQLRESDFPRLFTKKELGTFEDLLNKGCLDLSNGETVPVKAQYKNNEDYTLFRIAWPFYGTRVGEHTDYLLLLPTHANPRYFNEVRDALVAKPKVLIHSAKEVFPEYTK